MTGQVRLNLEPHLCVPSPSTFWQPILAHASTSEFNVPGSGDPPCPWTQLLWFPCKTGCLDDVWQVSCRPTAQARFQTNPDKYLLDLPPLPSWLKARPPSLPLTEQQPFPLPHHSLPEDAERPVVHSRCIFNQIQECHTEWRTGVPWHG